MAVYVDSKTPRRWKGTQSIQLINRTGNFFLSTQGANAAPVVENPDSQIAMLQSPDMPRRAITWMKNDALKRNKPTDDLDRLDPVELGKHLNVTNPKGTEQITIEVDGPDRETAARWTGGFCQAFLQWKRDISTRSKGEAVDTLSERAKKARRNLLDAEAQETAFKQSHQLADVKMQQEGVVKQYVEQEAKVQEAKSALDGANAKAKALQVQLGETNNAFKNGDQVRDDTLVLKLQGELSQNEIELANASQKFTADYPSVIPDLKAKIADVKDRLQKAVRSTLDNKRPSLAIQNRVFEEYQAAQTAAIIAGSHFKSESAIRDQMRAQTAGIPEESMTYARLSRNVGLARDMYTLLQNNLTQASIERATTVPNVQLLQEDPYVPAEPFLPNIPRDLAFGGVIGLFLAMVSVLVLEQADDRVRTMDSARRIAPGPVVGALPKLSRRQMSSLMSGKFEPNATEAFSLARANLSLVHRRNAHNSLWNKQVVLVTSAVPGEGKSLTAFHMARSMARAGRQVTLVDADMRRPSQNYLFNTDEAAGLADVLSGEMSLEDALVSSDVDNLTVLYSGTPRQNPSDLVSSQRMVETISALKEESDVVIIDTPACSVVADALMMAPYADCILHIIGAGQVGEAVVADAAAALQAASPKTLAFFVNRAPREKRTAYANYYHYGSTEPQTPVMLGLPPGTGSSGRGA